MNKDGKVTVFDFLRNLGLDSSVLFYLDSAAQDSGINESDDASATKPFFLKTIKEVSQDATPEQVHNSLNL